MSSKIKFASYTLNVVFILLAVGYFLLFHNPQNKEQASLNRAWQQFGTEVIELGKLVEEAPFNKDVATAADGYRHLARLLASFLATETDHEDPDFPFFKRFPNTVARIGWDNPDNPYLSARVRGDHRYRLRGNLKNFEMATFNVYSGMLGRHPNKDIRAVASANSDDLQVDKEGNFELLLGPQPEAGNWLKLADDAYILVVRRLSTDWDKTEAGSWEIVNLTTLGQGKPRVTESDVRQMLSGATMVTKNLRTMLSMAHRALFQVMGETNVMSQPKVADAGMAMYDPDQAAALAWFDLADDEALLIDAPVADCRFTNIQVGNPWMESVDYASHQSSLNNRQVHVDEDGRIRYVVASQDPGVANWVDTAGLNRGSLFARWTLCSAYPEGITSQVVKLSALASMLPATTPRISKQQRAKIIAKRQMAISRRYAGG